MSVLYIILDITVEWFPFFIDLYNLLLFKFTVRRTVAVCELSNQHF